jgi:hypothetical protein
VVIFQNEQPVTSAAVTAKAMHTFFIAPLQEPRDAVPHVPFQNDLLQAF